jgi:hypothetical protein
LEKPIKHGYLISTGKFVIYPGLDKEGLNV